MKNNNNCNMENQVKDNLRVERHIIKESHPYYNRINEFCFMSKNLYNFANYQIRQEFISNKKYISYSEIEKLVKSEHCDSDYRSMPTAQSAQQTLRLLDKNWQSFFASIKEYKKNTDKFTGRPKLPKYLNKNGRNILILTNQDCKIKDGYIKFPKAFNGFIIKTEKTNLQQVRILPRNKYLIIEVIYKVEIVNLNDDNGRYYSIDIGIDNFATVTNNFGDTPFVIRGIFVSNKGIKINADVNGSYQILKKVFPNAYVNGIAGVGLHPIVVNVI